MFHVHLKEVKKQIEVSQATKTLLNHKYWYYDTVTATGSEEIVKNLPVDEIPEETRDYKIQSFPVLKKL